MATLYYIEVENGIKNISQILITLVHSTLFDNELLLMIMFTHIGTTQAIILTKNLDRKFLNQNPELNRLWGPEGEGDVIQMK